LSSKHCCLLLLDLAPPLPHKLLGILQELAEDGQLRICWLRLHSSSSSSSSSRRNECWALRLLVSSPQQQQTINDVFKTAAARQAWQVTYALLLMPLTWLLPCCWWLLCAASA
jgi:hypothetical protein